MSMATPSKQRCSAASNATSKSAPPRHNFIDEEAEEVDDDEEEDNEERSRSTDNAESSTESIDPNAMAEEWLRMQRLPDATAEAKKDKLELWNHMIVTFDTVLDKACEAARNPKSRCA
jgi:hypothetical protein